MAKSFAFILSESYEVPEVREDKQEPLLLSKFSNLMKQVILIAS